ncbi:MAG: hypothetical protein HKP41_14505, partial [Desulfobacterales bacterium]|nr:hypothetical protein [Desulfobacterales bacterium]
MKRRPFALSTERRVGLLITLACAQLFLCGSTIAGEIPEKAWNALEAMREWEERIYLAMEQEDLPRFRVKRGIIRSPRPSAKAEGASGMPEIPEHSLGAMYDLAVTCQYPTPNQWCDENDIVLLLREAAPANLAVYFADGPIYYDSNADSAKLLELVTEVNIERLRLASEASYVDEYFGEEIKEWRTLLKEHVARNPPPMEATLALVEYYKEGIPEFTIRSYYYPAESLAWKHFREGPHFVYPSTPMENLDELCVAMAVADHTEAIGYCRIIADLLLNQSEESEHQKLGHQIEYYYQHIVDADDPKAVWLKIRWSYDENFGTKKCARPTWFMGESIPLGGWEELDAFYEDLSGFGVTASLERAQKRELISAGLKPADGQTEDPCHW